MTRNIFILFFLLYQSFNFSVLIAQSGDNKNVNKRERRLALCIGNDSYQNGSNLNDQPVNDANDMAEMLGNLDFKVMPVVINGTKVKMKNALQSFAKELKNYDVGLIFYSGHGSSRNGKNYLLPVDLENNLLADIEDQGISDTYLFNIMNEAGNRDKTNILILDACRVEGRGESGISEWKQPETIPSGFFTCFATSYGEKAYNSQFGRNGVFTSFLLKHINTPNINIEQLMKRVRIDISNLGGQEPEERTKLYSDFYFVQSTKSINNFEVDIEIKGYANDTLIVGNYFGEKQVVKDTLFSKGKGKFLWSRTEKPEQGVYLFLLKPENSFLQFIVNENDTEFSIKFDAKDLIDVSFKGSVDNKVFYEYLTFLKDKRTLADTLRVKIDRAKKAETTDKDAEDKLNQLDKDVKAYQHSIVDKYPQLITATLIKSNFEVDIPTFEGTEQETQMKRYLYYKEHYFDFIDINHPALIRTPFIHQKIDFYMQKLSSQQPDSLIKSVDRMLTLLEPNPEAYRYYLADFLNKYAQMKMVGLDAIYVHLVDKYYSKGKASWVAEENLTKMKDNADDLRPILIGKIMPDIVTYLEDGTPVTLSSIKSPYTVVIFWAPDCGHCKKIMPDVVAFYEKNKSKGVKVLGVCTKGGEKTITCWPSIKEKKMEGFINTADEYQRYNQKIRVKTTPKIFILDEKKEIIIKDIPGEEIDRIFNEILDFEEKKRMEKE